MNVIARIGYRVLWWLLLPVVLLGTLIEFTMKVLDVVEGWLFDHLEAAMLWIEHNLEQLDEEDKG